MINGAEELFDYLKEQKIPFTIASASIKPNIDFFVESFHLDRWIDPETIVYDDGLHPDKVSMFIDAANRLDRPIEEFTVIEDSLAGVDCSIRSRITDIRIIDSNHIGGRVKNEPAVKQICNDMSEIDRSL